MTDDRTALDEGATCRREDGDMADGTIRLQVDSGREVEGPSQELVLAALQAMERGEETYVILERESSSGDFYVQSAAHHAGGWSVEYQDGSLDQHYGLRVDDIQQVHDIFSWWVIDQPGWREGLPWERVEV